jgi:peptidoglycan/xylan/chitin deacetylase (PgdA/CDA1 family)
MNPLKRSYYYLSSIFPTRLLAGITQPPTLLPYHHLVSDQEVLHLKHLYTFKNTSQFIDDLDCLLKYFKPISGEDLLDSLKRDGKYPKRSFLISFDDGFRELYDVVAPILIRKGIPALFFINPAFIDNKILFYRCKISLVIEGLEKRNSDKELLRRTAELMGSSETSIMDLKPRLKAITNVNQNLLDRIGEDLGLSFEDYLKAVRPFLSHNQLNELAEKGFTIGAHSWDHPYYKGLPESEQISQTMESCRFVKEQFHPSLLSFSFPHSDKEVDSQVLNRILDAEPKIDLLFGIQNQKSEPGRKILHRFNAERPEMPMRYQLNGLLLYMWMTRLSGHNKVKRN